MASQRICLGGHAKYKIYITYYGVKGSRDPSPFYIKPKAYAAEEKMSEDEQRESRLPGYTAEDNPVLSESWSGKRKVSCHQGESPRAS